MKNKLILLLLLFVPILSFAQRNPAYDNVEVRDKLYVGGEVIINGTVYYKGTALNNYFTPSAITYDTTAYKLVDDTVTGVKSRVTNVQNAFTSNNSRASFTATSADSAIASYTFPTFVPVGDITGVNLVVEYFNVDTIEAYVYFGSGGYKTSNLTLPLRHTTDTSLVLGSISNVLGLTVLEVLLL